MCRQETRGGTASDEAFNGPVIFIAFDITEEADGILHMGSVCSSEECDPIHSHTAARGQEDPVNQDSSFIKYKTYQSPHSKYLKFEHVHFILSRPKLFPDSPIFVDGISGNRGKGLDVQSLD